MVNEMTFARQIASAMAQRHSTLYSGRFPSAKNKRRMAHGRSRCATWSGKTRLFEQNLRRGGILADRHNRGTTGLACASTRTEDLPEEHE